MVKEFNSKILKIEEPAKDVRILKLEKPSDLDFRPGQYFSLSVINENGQKIRRPYSIASSPSEKDFEICVKKVDGGLASEYIWGLKEGDEVELFGAMGKFFITDFDKDFVFVSSGVGIAPFRSIIKDLLENGFKENIFLLAGFRNESESVYLEFFENLKEKYSNFDFEFVYSREKSDFQGYVQDFLEDFVPTEFDGEFYVCGLSKMVEDSKEKLIELGFEKDRIFFEKWD